MKQRKFSKFSSFELLRTSKQAQITVFIIIGILILIAFGTTIYVTSKIGKSTEATIQQKEQLGIQPIEDYVTTCLQMSTREGLALLGKQGGLIYKTQGGLNDIPLEHIQYTDPELGMLNMPFLILPPKGNVGTTNCATPEQRCGKENRPECCLFYSDAPYYPYLGFPFLSDGSTLYNGYFGINQLPPLYKKTPDERPVSNSIQENLELYIAKRTAECTNWKTFEDKNYKINPGQPTASLIFAEKKQIEQFTQLQTFGEQYISVELHWPIEITTPSGEKSIQSNFADREPVRLVTNYFTIKQMLDADATDISYKPESTGSFTTSTIQSGENAIIIIKDSQSKIANKPYEFWIARKNRAPALWHINEAQFDGIKFHVKEDRGASISIEGNKLIIKDICQEADKPDPFIIELNASDPDENEVIYEATPKEIPGESAIGMGFVIKVYAKNNNSQEYDYQDIPVQVALCIEE